LLLIQSYFKKLKPIDVREQLVRKLLKTNDKDFKALRKKELYPPFISLEKNNLYSEERMIHMIFRDKTLSRLTKLKKYFKELKVIVSIRRQADWCISSHLYGIDKHNKKEVPFEESFVFAEDYEFERSLTGRIASLMNKQAPCVVIDDRIDYLDFYKNLLKFLPQKNIHFVPMEGLFSSDDTALKNLVSFITEKPVSEADCVRIAKLKDFKVNKGLHPRYAKEKQRFKESVIAQRIFNKYTKSNRKLDRLLGLDLKQLGYY
jgi:hypothetical protein